MLSLALLTNTIITWLMLLVLAILNGTLRNIVYKPWVGDLWAHQISTVVAIVVFTAVIFLRFKDQVSQYSYGQLLWVGIVWVGMTIIFEFIGGHYLFGNSWEKLLADYNIFKGRVWVLVLATELLAPVVIKYFSKNAS